MRNKVARSETGAGFWRSNFPILFVALGLGAIYLYQRRGGRVSDLYERGREGVKTARDAINRYAPNLAEKAANMTGTNRERNASPESRPEVRRESRTDTRMNPNQAGI